MATYVRFETPFCCAVHDRPLGVFRSVSRLEESADLPDWMETTLSEALDWFNEHLPVPTSQEFDRRAIFWFHRQSEVVREMWQLVSVFREAGIHISLRRTTMPGRIVYRDEFQVAAIPYGHGRRCTRRK